MRTSYYDKRELRQALKYMKKQQEESAKLRALKEKVKKVVDCTGNTCYNIK